MNLETLTIAEARRALDAKEYSALQLTNAYLDAIAKKDGEIHAYLEVWADSAREEAKAADAVIARAESQPLTGIPIAVKDNMLIEGRIVSAASKILENYRASYDATVISKLKAQNAVFLGRTNMDEFALGSDTGGSIRQPAAFCGVVGLKPTYGAVSRSGLIAAASSLDQIGTLAKNVGDAKILFDAIRGHDPMDSTSLPDNAAAAKGERKTIGVPREFLNDLNAEVRAQFDATVQTLKDKGYSVVDVALPSLQYALAVYYIINPAEVSTNLARLDGIRYGLSVPADVIGEVYSKTRAAGFGAETRRRILVGTFVLSSGYADAYYRKARSVRELIRADFAKAFQTVDAIVMPTTPSPAFKLGEKNNDPVSLYLEDIFTVPVNLAGVPAISVPGGSVERDGKKLPVGFQIIGAWGGEEMLFKIAANVDKSGL